jgi:pSer/pThr/pTyr-binding forkhead associated (FHA) protein
MSLPFVLYDGPGGTRATELDGRVLSIGRRSSCDVALPWDREVSRLHAELSLVGGAWVVCDAGLSRNGTFLNGERVLGRRRLRTGDALRVGATVLTVCDGDPSSAFASTRVPRPATIAVTPGQRRVLAALCRPLEDGHASPASNRQIADELVIGIETVKSTLATLFERFGLREHPRHQKRAALAQRALALSGGRSLR